MQTFEFDQLPGNQKAKGGKNLQKKKKKKKKKRKKENGLLRSYIVDTNYTDICLVVAATKTTLFKTNPAVNWLIMGFKWAAAQQNKQNDMCTQRNLRCPHEETLGP